MRIVIGSMAAAALLLVGCSSDPDPIASETGTTATGDGESGESAGESGESHGDESGETHGETDADTDTETETGPPEPFCGDGNVDPGEDCDDGNDDDFDGCLSDCTAVEPLDPPELTWEYFEIPGTRCMDGSTAGFGVNYNPDSANVMIYLEGGGACFSDACDFTAFNIPFIPPADGIFSRSNNNNPVRDWTMIYVPYCTGDIHAGDAEAELGGQTRQFRGYSNITTYLQRWVPSFPAQHVLLTGISAGGFGAALNTAQVADAYGDQVQLSVIDDSGPPFTNDVIPPCLQQTFRETWNLDDTVLADCGSCDPNDFATGLMDHVLTNYPDVNFGLFSNTGDAVISTYMGAGWGNGQWNNCAGIPTPIPGSVYSDGLDAIRSQYMADASTFYIFGIGHTVLRLGFNITFAEFVPLTDWIADVLDGQIVHLGP